MTRSSFLIAVILTAILQTGAIAGMMYKYALQINSGREVIVQSGFLDPRDLFRGHYVILNLAVGDLRSGTVKTDSRFTYREDVFVELKKGDDGFWFALKLWHEIPTSHDSAFLKGQIRSIPLLRTGRYRITFPQDRYFAPKKRAKELEKLRRDRKLGVILAVTSDGSGFIKGITIDGKKIYDEPVW
ncbi:MAG: GDYXXLXY domain-containing protein [Rhizobiaceae bacterium]|nr:GDYXXLXY domain-containing protein [Rhizobiaceae bacterium]